MENVHKLLTYRVKEKRCTRYIDNTTHPKWEQSFTFRVEEDELNLHKIKMAAWDYFQPKQNMFIGVRVVDLSSEYWSVVNVNDPRTPRNGVGSCVPHVATCSFSWSLKCAILNQSPYTPLCYGG